MNKCECPSCNNNINLWTVIKAPLPTHIRCPHCQTQLKFSPSCWKMIIPALGILCVIFLFVISAILNMADSSQTEKLLLIFSVLFLLAIPCEFLLSFFLHSRYDLMTHSHEDTQNEVHH